MLLYIKKDIAYKLRNDLKMYKSKHLESTFIEIINQKKKNIILGCVYNHPCMEVNEFKNDHFSYLSENLLGEKSKNVMGDFNVDLLKYKNDSNTDDNSYLFESKIKDPSGNIFITDNAEDTISGNILTTISDHLAQFILYPAEQLKRDSKMDIYKQSFRNFKQHDFQRDLENINRDRALKIDENQTSQSYDRFFNVFETLLDTHVPLKKFTKTEVKLHLKPWLTNYITTSMIQNNKLY